MLSYEKSANEVPIVLSMSSVAFSAIAAVQIESYANCASILELFFA